MSCLRPHFFAALVLLASPSVGPAQTAAGSSVANSVRVAFWNIEWFPGGRPNAYRGEQIRQTRAVHEDIPKLNADVIGFAEVRDWDNAGLAVQPLPGFKVDVCSTFPPREDQTDTQQVAIVSRLQPMSAWAEMWKANGVVVPPRGFAFAAYEVAPRQLLLVYSLHLKSNRGAILENIAIREESMRQLADHMQAMEKSYAPLGAITWIIGGDLNTAPDDPRFAKEKTFPLLLGKGFRWTWEGMPLSQRVTLPPSEGYPAACFDHILYRGATLRKAEAVPTSQKSSDHRAVRAEFSLGGQR